MATAVWKGVGRVAGKTAGSDPAFAETPLRAFQSALILNRVPGRVRVNVL